MPSKLFLRKYSFVTGFIILLLYNFHRYIFQYNFEGTSPTYTNTPVIWKVGKYFLMINVLAFFYLGLTFKPYVNRFFVIIYLIVFFVLIVNVLNVAIYKEVNIDELQYCLWFLLTIPYWFAEEKLTDIKLNYKKLIIYAAIILFMSNAFAIANYLLTGRLPALGYEGGLVRFGGFWDDPNAFGIICVFLFYYLVNNKKYILAVFALVSMIYTFSFTAYLIIIVSLIYWIFASYKAINVKWLIGGIGIVLLTLTVAGFTYNNLVELYAVKESSVNDHLNTSLIFNLVPLLSSPLQFSENWYKSSFNNYFPVSVFVDCCFLVLFISLFRNSRNKELKFYFFLFIICSFFFSMLYVFPLNFLFIFLLADHLKSGQKSFRNPETASELVNTHLSR